MRRWGKAFHVRTLSQRIHSSQPFEREEGAITKRALLYGFCDVVEGNRLMNLDDSQLQLLYLHARIRPSVTRREASRCSCSGTASPGAAPCFVERLLLIPLEATLLLKPASQPSGIRIHEVSVQTP